VLTEPALHAELLAEQRARRERWGAARMAADWKRVYAGIAEDRRCADSTDLHYAPAEPIPKIGVPWS
ncbi:MAG: hypothetical protein ACRDK0_04225, partial [Solirubrobacteraceae bacterium]